MVADIDKKIRNVVRKTCTETCKMSLLKGVKINNKKVIKLVDVGAPNLWDHLKGGILRAGDEVCGKNGRKSKVDAWWMNKEMKEAVSRKKETHKVMCQNSTEEIKRRNKSMKSKAKKAVSKEMR